VRHVRGLSGVEKRSREKKNQEKKNRRGESDHAKEEDIQNSRTATIAEQKKAEEESIIITTKHTRLRYFSEGRKTREAHVVGESTEREVGGGNHTFTLKG